MSPQVNINLGDVATEVGVSRTTVSLALRNSPRISVAVRVRVHTVAERLGYRPNPLIAAHMAYVRTRRQQSTGHCIAFVCNRSLAEMERDQRTPAYKYFLSARARAEALGFHLDLFNLNEPGMNGRRLAQVLQARGVGGVVIHPTTDGRALQQLAFDLQPFAVALIEHVGDQPQLHKVCDDQFATIARLIQRMLDRGYHRIGIAMHRRMDEHVNHAWLAGYQTYQALEKNREHLPHFITESWDRESFLRWFERWRPDAIITVDGDPVIWLREAGYSVPETAACATVYWKEDRAFLSGFYQHHELIASGAVDLVVSQLNRNERGIPDVARKMLVDSIWKEGATLPHKTQIGSSAALRLRSL